LAALFGVFQIIGLDPYNWNTDFGLGHRVASTSGNPAFHGCFMMMVIPLVLSRVFNKQYWYVPILLLLVFALYQTKARAAFVGCAASLVFFFTVTGWQYFLKNRIKCITIVVVIAGVAVYADSRTSHPVVNRFFVEPFVKTETGHRLGGSTLERLVQLKAVLKIIRDYPVFGIGPDTLGMMYPRYCVVAEYGGFENQNRVHNELLDIVVATGLCGGMAFVWLILSYSLMVRKVLRKLEDLTVVGIVASILGYAVQGLFSFGHIPIIMLFWVLLGLSVVMCGGEYENI